MATVNQALQPTAYSVCSAPASGRFEEITMAMERLSHLQHCILAWLLAEAQRTRGTMAASHQDLVHALAATTCCTTSVEGSSYGLDQV